jgi:ornithine carbamoyltransferase
VVEGRVVYPSLVSRVMAVVEDLLEREVSVVSVEAQDRMHTIKAIRLANREE